jgi:hypothetical protein
MDYENILSRKVQDLQFSGIRKFFDIAASYDDVISLSVVAVLAIGASRHCFVYVKIDISLHSFFSSRLKSLFKPVAALIARSIASEPPTVTSISCKGS